MKIAIVDSRISKDALGALSCHTDKIIKLPPFTRLQNPVSAHPDMLLFPAEQKIITSASYFEENRSLFEELSVLSGREIAVDSSEVAPSYPQDVKFNCFVAGGQLFGLVSALSEQVLHWARGSRIPVVNIRQGYAKCSTCIVTHNTVITEDAGIERAMQNRGIDVLRITSGQVALDGYDCGFIGGASGTDSESVYFCGDISKHPDFDKIDDFCRRHGKNCISLGSDSLYDVGTIFFIE